MNEVDFRSSSEGASAKAVADADYAPWGTFAVQTIALPVLLVLTLCLVIFTGPFLLSDGPAHLGMANFLLHVGDPAWPLQAKIYEINPNFSPNLGGELVLLGLMKLLPPLAAEQALQAICLLSIPLAGFAVLRRISPAAGGLAVFFIPLAFQRMFFLGLYNFSLSMTGCLLCVWGYLFLRERFCLARTTPLTVLMTATLVFQASGWLESVVAIGAMVLVDSWGQWRRGRGIHQVLREIFYVAVASLPSFALFVFFLLTGGGNSKMAYGTNPLSRLLAILKGDPMGTIGRGTTLAGIALFLILLVLALRQALKLYRNWLNIEPRRRDLALGLLAVPPAFVLFALIIPDTAGGGWTHAWRAEAFPYLGLVLAASPLVEKSAVRLMALGAAVAAACLILGSVFRLQTVYTPAVLAEFNEADAFIGSHCTVAPVLFDYKLERENIAQVVHHPMFHIASHLELKNDRVVLFNYIARLPVYPVRYRAGVDPHPLLYHWGRGESDTHIYRVDVANFERQTQIPIDYLLVWGPPGPEQQDLWRQVHESASQDFKLVHRGRTGRLELYQRTKPSVGCVPTTG